jgi:hypothetical protein
MAILDPSINKWIATSTDPNPGGDGSSPDKGAVVRVALDGGSISVAASSGEPASTPPAPDVLQATMLSLSKRRALIEAAPKLRAKAMITASGNTALTALNLGANQRIVIVALRIQNMWTTETTLILRGNTANLEDFHIPGQYGAGIDQVFSLDTYIRWIAGENITVNLSNPGNFKVTVRYFVEDTTTGLPI